MLKRELDKRKQLESSISVNVQGSSEGSAESPKDIGNSPNKFVCGQKTGQTIGRIRTVKLEEEEEPRYSPNVKNRQLEKYGIEFCAKNLSKRKLDSASPPPNCFGIISHAGEGKWKSICLKTIMLSILATFVGWFVFATYFYVTHRNHRCP
ncbi:hypothetical protein TTRE_0000144701 [Trichuris trichiura]|uniref:Uncharacterized protein n=1 Tax=Trichuris trichiura TaxID=36087 RepID=A0A077YZK4_TRITR|nr:hypothetical protein TTRE_0000144701 [Trichuris trichiura]